MKKLVLTLSAVFVICGIAQAAPSSEAVIEVQKAEKVYVHYKIFSPVKTTLILLPGVFRASD